MSEENVADASGPTRCLRQSLLCCAVTPVEQYQLERDQEQGDGVRPPDVEAVAPHGEKFAEALPVHIALTHSVLRSRSRMMARTRMSAAAIEYIQNENVMTSMPASIAAAMLGLLVRLTDAP